MSTKVEKSIVVDVPVNAVYNQWTQFEEFPEFMGGVERVTQLDDVRLHWVAEIFGVRREWDATILEQVPDVKIAWAATEGATNAGAVYFAPVGAGQTQVRLSLEFAPEGIVEKVGDMFDVVEKQAEADLERFKAFIEQRGSATGAWRGEVAGSTTLGTPGIEEAAASEGTSGKAGLSTVAKVAGAAVAAAGVAAAGAMKSKSGSSEGTSEIEGEEGTTAEATPVEAHDVERARSTEIDDVVTYDAAGQSLNESIDIDPADGRSV
jgi:uncharacterized protein YndB with AHSA1/START domain